MKAKKIDIKAVQKQAWERGRKEGPHQIGAGNPHAKHNHENWQLGMAYESAFLEGQDSHLSEIQPAENPYAK